MAYTHLHRQKIPERIHCSLGSRLVAAQEEQPFRQDDACWSFAYSCLEHRRGAYFRKDPRSGYLFRNRSVKELTKTY